MTRVTVRETIAAPAAFVFDAVSNVENLPATNPDILRIEFRSELRSGVGTVFRETRAMGKKEHVTELEVTEYVLNERVRMVADTNGTIWDTVFTVKPAGDAVELTICMDARPHSLLPKILNPLFKGLFRRGMAKHIRALKEYCERASAAGDRAPS